MFCSLDLASSLKVADGRVTKAAGEELVEARAIVRKVASRILQMIFSCPSSSMPTFVTDSITSSIV